MEQPDIKLLVEKYEEGLTTEAEEAVLAAFFCSGEVPAEWEAHRAAFTFFGEARDLRPDPNFEQRILSLLEKEAPARQRTQGAGRWIRLQPKWWPQVAAVLLVAGGFATGYWVKDYQDARKSQYELDQLRLATAMSLMHQESPHQRLQGLAIAQKIQSPNEQLLEELLKVLNTDENANLRLTAVQAIAPYATTPKVREQLIASLDKQYSLLIQLSILKAIQNLKDAEEKQQLKRLLRHPNIDEALEKEIEKKL